MRTPIGLKVYGERCLDIIRLLFKSGIGKSEPEMLLMKDGVVVEREVKFSSLSSPVVWYPGQVMNSLAIESGSSFSLSPCGEVCIIGKYLDIDQTYFMEDLSSFEINLKQDESVELSIEESMKATLDDDRSSHCFLTISTTTKAMKRSITIDYADLDIIRKSLSSHGPNTLLTGYDMQKVIKVAGLPTMSPQVVEENAKKAEELNKLLEDSIPHIKSKLLEIRARKLELDNTLILL
jgi:hypothetical protein